LKCKRTGKGGITGEQRKGILTTEKKGAGRADELSIIPPRRHRNTNIDKINMCKSLKTEFLSYIVTNKYILSRQAWGSMAAMTGYALAMIDYKQ
jgi:hypothetical protein